MISLRKLNHQGSLKHLRAVQNKKTSLLNLQGNRITPKSIKKFNQSSHTMIRVDSSNQVSENREDIKTLEPTLSKK